MVFSCHCLFLNPYSLTSAFHYIFARFCILCTVFCILSWPRSFYTFSFYFLCIHSFCSLYRLRTRRKRTLALGTQQWARTRVKKLLRIWYDSLSYKRQIWRRIVWCMSLCIKLGWNLFRARIPGTTSLDPLSMVEMPLKWQKKNQRKLQVTSCFKFLLSN